MLQYAVVAVPSVLVAFAASLVVILMFAAAAFPPPLSKYQPGPASYMAFAIITGILAVVAGLIYCCAMIGCVLNEGFDKKEANESV